VFIGLACIDSVTVGVHGFPLKRAYDPTIRLDRGGSRSHDIGRTVIGVEEQRLERESKNAIFRQRAVER